MKNVNACFAVVVSLLCACVSSGSAHNAAVVDRIVSVSVSVQDSAGAPVQGVAAVCERRGGPIVGAITAANGTCSIAYTVPEGAVTLYLSLVEAYDDLSPAVASAARDKYRQTIQASHFKQWYSTLVPANATTATLTIAGTQATSVTFHAAANATGRRRLSATCSHSAPTVARDNDKPDVVLLGIERGQPAMFALSGTFNPSVKVIEFTGPQMMVDKDVPDIVVSDVQGSETCVISVPDRVQMVQTPELLLQCVTLISEDRARLLVYRIDGRNRVVNEGGRDPRLAPGVYAVVPGMIGLDPGPDRVFGEMKRTNVVPPGVAAITVVAGGPNTFTIQSVPARDASLALPAYP